MKLVITKIMPNFVDRKQSGSLSLEAHPCA